uniref:Uncharacterized protein n=1 Tax=Alexandrium catenella TaxID=2925 RepID=A0A7S1MMC7_ALECA
MVLGGGPLKPCGVMNVRDKRPLAVVSISGDGTLAEVTMDGKVHEVPIDPVAGPLTIAYDGTMKPMRLNDYPMHNKWGIPWQTRLQTQQKVLIITALERTQTLQKRMKETKGRLDPRIPDFLEGIDSTFVPYSSKEQNFAINSLFNQPWDWEDDPDAEVKEEKKAAAAEAAKKMEEQDLSMYAPAWTLASWGHMPDPSQFHDAATGQPAAPKPVSRPVAAPEKAAKPAAGKEETAKADKADKAKAKAPAKPKSRFSPNARK